MGQFVIIGLSTFGDVLARTLYSLGENVLVIDADKDKIQEIKDNVTQAVVADAMDKKILEALIQETEATVIICLGDFLEQSVMVTYYLKQLGIKKIIAKANSQDQGKVLQMLGASEIVYPERDIAITIAHRLSNPALLEQFPLTKDYSILEIAVPSKFVGNSLISLKLRNEYGINVLLIKQNVGGEATVVLPTPEYVFQKSDVMVTLGHKKDFNRLPVD
jgi:trk system potassium uptake protein TrkA